MTVTTVFYTYELQYRDPETVGESPFPGLVLEVRNPATGHAVAAIAHLDSGAQTSLFDGDLGGAIGLDRRSGRLERYATTAHTVIEALLHPVVLVHDELGTFPLEIGFSTAPIARNLLGRDFFRLIQLGFRESLSLLYVEAAP